MSENIAHITMLTEESGPDDFTTLEVARLFGMSVRSVQLMVDRGELEAWKTPGGHRRIARSSAEQWRRSRNLVKGPVVAQHDGMAGPEPVSTMVVTDGVPRPRILLIDDSIHFQKLVAMLIRQCIPEVDLHIADDGIAGLALYGQLQPQVLIVDILLPGIDGATLITSLRSHPQFAHSHLVVVTSLDEEQRGPYRFALEHVPVVHKPRLVAELPPLLSKWLGRGDPAGRPATP
jgi:excisionase family DNA binding protein